MVVRVLEGREMRRFEQPGWIYERDELTYNKKKFTVRKQAME